MKAKILIIEDNQSLAASLKRVMEMENYDVTCAADAAQGLALATSVPFSAVVTDLQLAGPKGLEVNAGLNLIRELHEARPQLPVILMTAHHSTETAIEATKLGAYDYIPKPFDTALLLDLIEKAVQSSRLMSEPVELGQAEATLQAIIGNSRAMQDVYKEIGRVAAKPVTVLIRGETGTGKELIARAIYQHSDRSQQPFIVVNCVAIPETLLESELFGHEQGAFTGATARRIGRFEQANQGTIFLDEIGDMTMSTQAKLLRVLQEKTIQRVGGKETIPVDVRIIAATHRALETAIAQGEFREDLFYRLNVAVIKVPPLRERKEDIADHVTKDPTTGKEQRRMGLVSYFLHRYGPELGAPKATISPEAMEYLQQQSWPGNVRELENVIRKALLAAHGYGISLDHVRSALDKTKLSRLVTNQSVSDYVSELLAAAARGELSGVQFTLNEAVERELYAQAINLAQGNQAKAAKWLGVSRPTMREKLKLYGLRSLPERHIESDAL